MICLSTFILSNVSLWPFAVLDIAVNSAWRPSAIRRKAEPGLVELLKDAFDPKENFGAILGWWLLQTR